MSSKIAVDKSIEKAMKSLGKLIKECREKEKRGLRKIAEPCGIPASQLLSIENGALTPTADVYAKLVYELQPDDKIRRKMDNMFMTIRKTPPPDICDFFICNSELTDAIRALPRTKLTPSQLDALKKQFEIFAEENGKETKNHGENI